MISLLGLRDNLWQLRDNLIYNLHTSDRFQLPKDKMTDETCSRMTSQESEYFFKHIKDAIALLRLGRQRPDNKRIPKFVQWPVATNIDQDCIDQILQEMLTNNLIYNKPTESRPSYYVTGKTVVQMFTQTMLTIPNVWLIMILMNLALFTQ